MKSILTIDHRPFLFESQADAMKTMALLSKSVALQWDYQDVHQYTRGETPELKLEACSSKTRILTAEESKKRKTTKG